MFSKKSIIIAIAAIICAASVAQAHIEMLDPLPLRSKNNKNVAEGDKDYSMTKPLSPNALADGEFPCKGYHKTAQFQGSVATYTAGQDLTVKLAGTATHNGGSCQIALSYDDGTSWKVIHSFMGGCPLNTDLPLKMPTDVPSGRKVLFAWTWFNHSGNREMYMNCARVDINGKSTSAGSWNMPSLYLANIFGSDKCQTIENMDYTFPYPGKYVTRSGNNLSDKTQVTAGCPDYASGKPSGTVNGEADSAPAPVPSTETTAAATATMTASSGDGSGSGTISPSSSGDNGDGSGSASQTLVAPASPTNVIDASTSGSGTDLSGQGSGSSSQGSGSNSSGSGNAAVPSSTVSQRTITRCRATNSY